MNRKAVVFARRLVSLLLPALVALSFVNSALGSPYVPLAWQSRVEFGPHIGMRKHVGWIHDANGDFIDDAFDALTPGEQTQVIVQLNECFGSLQDYGEYFRPYGDLIHKGVLVAYVILEGVPKEKLQALADDPRVAALEFPRPLYALLDTSTRVVRARASTTHGSSTFPNVQGAGDGSGVTIAIVDTGVDDGHGAFAGSSPAGYNAITGTAGNPDDDNVYIDTGATGICQSTAAGDDVQLIPLNQGEPHMASIGAGANGMLNSTRLGDDTIGTVNGVPAIGTGANGVNDSIRGGDDVQWIPRWQGAPWNPCVLPGANGRINTAAGGDDNLNEVFHGTHVAGIALGRATAGAGNTRNADDGSTPNNGTGMAPGASLLDVKVVDASGSAQIADLLDALDWIFKDGRADVLNMSLNNRISGDGTSTLSKVVDALVAHDIAVAISVGNTGSRLIGSPADSEFATTVAWAQDLGTVSSSADTIHADSSFGPRIDYDKNNLTVGMLKPDIAAPGGGAAGGAGIMSAMGNNTTNDYHAVWGSSMASPHVAGAMALLIELGRNSTPKRHIPPGALKDLLKRTADRSMASHSAMDATVDSDYDDHWGYGLLNVYEAAKQLKKGIADVSFPAAIGPHPQYPTVRRCKIKGGKASYENDFDIRLAEDPPVVGKLNTISVDIENRSTAKAENVVVSVGVIDFGVGGQVYDGNSVTVKVLPGKDPVTGKPGKTTVDFDWKPRSVNHQCIQATIDYGLDTDFSNNLTQRNIKKVKTSSPGESRFVVRNPLNERATIILEPKLDAVTRRNFSIEISATQFEMEPEDCPQLVDIQFFPNRQLPTGTTGRVDISATAFTESAPDGIELTGVVFNVAASGPPRMTQAFAFGSRQLSCPTFNEPAVHYTMVHHGSPADLEYSSARGWGYEVLYPETSPYGHRGGYGVFGPFDDSPNDRNKFPDACPEELYDSFVGAKDFTNECSGATVGNASTPCASAMTPEGIIFRVDVPNGTYRFVGAFGDADNVHAHRILAEDGGSGPPENIGPNHVVLVSNFDQAQQRIGEADAVELGEGVYARVGFDGKIPPPGDGVAPSPQFVSMDRNGFATDGPPRSPILEVTQGYIRIHQLQGNSNDGPGGPRDGNGGDIVILELWRVEPPEPVCAPELVGVDVGEPLPPGSMEPCPWHICGDGAVVTAGGTDIWGTADQFFYAYDDGAPRPGALAEHTIIARVDSMESPALHAWAKAGIMVRETFDPGSRHVMVVRTPGNGVEMQGRDATNGESWRLPVGGSYGPEDVVWLRLDRAGGTVTASYAIGGETQPGVWLASVSREDVLPSDPLPHVGLATTSHEQGVPIEVAYANFCIGPYTGPAVLVDPDLADSPAGGDGYVGIREVIDNGEIPDQTACYRSLASGGGTIVDYEAPVLNMEEGGGGNYGNDDVFGVVMAGHRAHGDVDHLSMIARGTIRIPPGEGGDYTFGVNSDDGFTLAFPGHDFVHVVGGEIANFESGAAMRFYGNRGASDTLGVIKLPPGDHPFWLTYHEAGGGASVEMYAGKGIFPTIADFDPSQLKLVGFNSPDDVPIPGICNEFNMKASEPGFWSGGQVLNLQNGLDALTEGDFFLTNSVGVYSVVNHSDPDDGANDPAWSGWKYGDLVFPNNNTGNDEDFGVLVTGELDIPAASRYQIGYNSDDGAALQIHGHAWNSIVPGSHGSAILIGDQLITDALTGWSWTAGEIDFPSAGCYEFTALMFERGGGSFFELFGRGVSPSTGLPGLAWHILKVGGAQAMHSEDGLQLVGAGLECFPHCHPDYEQWVAVGKPECWCYPTQCHGDADGNMQGSDKTGVMYVGTSDLNVLISAWQVKEPPHGSGITSVPNGICADFNHRAQGSEKSGMMRVGTDDLNILIAGWLKKEPPKGPGIPPDCLDCP